MALTVRPARAEDAAVIAGLLDIASEGLARWLWTRIAAPGEDPLSVGTRHSAIDDSDHSWRKTQIAEIGGAVAGGLSCYLLPEVPEPAGEEANPMMAVARSLEARAPGTLHIYQLATLPAFRRQGVARALLAVAEREACGRGMSLLVMEGNAAAIALYCSAGYGEAARTPLPQVEGWVSESKALVLLKPAAGRYARVVRRRGSAFSRARVAPGADRSRGAGCGRPWR